MDDKPERIVLTEEQQRRRRARSLALALVLVAPEQNSITLRIGEVVTVNYTVTNESARESIGQASYNVWPPTAGAYFSKINCFCFTEQRLKAGETREMPVVFFVDPEIAKD